MSSYNNVAWAYDRLANGVFRGDVLKSQIQFIDLIPSNSNVLIVGGGTGKVLDNLNQLGIMMNVDFIEPSTKMMEIANRRTDGCTNLKINFFQVELEAFQSSTRYDAVCCFYFLDLFETPELLHCLALIENLMKSSSILIVSDFQNLTNKRWQKVLSGVMHIFFRLTTNLESKTLKNIRSLILDKGFIEIKSHIFFNQFIFSAVYKKNVS